MNARLSAVQLAALTDLIEALLEERIAPEDAARLDRWIGRDEAARWVYVQYANVYAGLCWDRGSERERQAESESPGPETPVCAPVQGFLGSAASGTLSSLTTGWALAYLIATVVCGIGLAIGALTHVSEPPQVARQSFPLPSPLSPLPSVVGRITGMVDCSGQWSVASGQRQSESRLTGHWPLATGHSVTLGDRFNLSSGLLEITYDTGARVILQGPVTYEVESAAGGYLSLGKLTARVENRAEGGKRKAEESTNPKSETISKSPNLQISKFVVRTPTALVTDLGTEFGVEVARSGETTSHVFRGSIRVQRTSTDGTVEPDGKIVTANQTVRVESLSGNRRIVTLHTFAPSHFVRQFPRQRITTFDLVDVVAGGDGFSGKRGRGINPATGQPADNAQVNWNARSGKGWHEVAGDHEFHRVEANPFVDGVFIPDGSQGPVKLDSAGHTYELDSTLNLATMHIWAGGVVIAGKKPQRLRTELGGVEYAAPGHGLIFLHANSAITFDLDAIRRANPNRKITRFRAVAGNTEMRSQEAEPKHTPGADLWVFVDGKLEFKRREVTYYMGAQPVNLVLSDHNRFLTLVSTDGANDLWCDWIIFGDPRLELVETTTPNPAKGDSTEQ